MSASDQNTSQNRGEKLGEWVLRFRFAVIIVSVLTIIGLMATGVRGIHFSTNYRAFFSEENPELKAFDDLQATYTKNDNILFVLQPKGTGSFDADTLTAVTDLTERAWQIPFATRVDSLSNFQHTWADGDDLTVEDLVEDPIGMDDTERERRQAIALAEPLLLNNLISPDAHTQGINVTLYFPEKSITEVPEAVGVAREMANEIRAAHPDLHVAISGLSMLNNSFAESGQGDMKNLYPIMLLLLFVVTWIALRSFGAMLATLPIVILSAMAAIAMAGHAKIGLTPISITAPIIILTLAIADSIHLLVIMRKLMLAGVPKREALVRSMGMNLVPITVTSITTIIGFLALNFSETPPFWHLGNMTAVGIAAAWILSLTLLPALISILPFKVKADPEKTGDIFSGGLLGKLAEFVIAKRGPVLIGTGLLALIFVACVPRLSLNDEWVKYFDHRTDFRKDSEFAQENLTGLYALQYSLPSGEEGGISSPEYLQHLEAFTGWLREQPEIRHVYSFSDIMKRLNKNMNGDDPAFYRIPQNRELAAQFLLLYELSLPQGLDLNDRISVDKASTRISATFPEISTLQTRALMARSEQWLVDNTPEHMHVLATGPSAMFSLISRRNIEGMLTGNILALFLIAAVIALAMRSFRLGLLSLIPNSLPILVTFGIWALLIGQVGMAAATVTATSLGIVVDDTVHFLAKFLHARRHEHASREDAVRYAFQTAGPAIFATTIILVAGFAVLCYSTFRINFEMGLLTSIAIVAAFIFDLTLLPALLLMGKKKNKLPLTEPKSATA